MMKERSGWVVISEGRVIGCISFSDWQYRRDILIHCFIDPDFHGRWTSRGIYRRVFDYAFNDLDLPRVSGYAIPGHNDLAAKALRSLGFRKEGTVRKGIRESDDRLYDMDIYGILKEERRF
jgi:RimJ/RimL family protein N-acetyltransferase